MGSIVLAAFLALTHAAPSSASAAIGGRVVSADGHPVAGAKIEARAALGPAEAELAAERGEEPPVAAEAVSGPDGHFRLRLPSGRFTVSAGASALARAEYEGEVDGGDVEDLGDIALERAAPVSGRVMDASGKPVSGALVEIVGAGDPAEAAGEITRAVLRTGVDGSFRASDAPPEIRSVRVRAAGFVEVRRTRIFAALPSSMTLTMTRGGSVAGRVTTAGAPASGAIVRAGGHAVRTGADGSFEIAGIALGAATVRAELGSRLGFASARVERDKTASVAISLLPAASAAGQVLDAKTRRPISGARVSFSEQEEQPFGRLRAAASADLEEAPPSARSDRRGRFRIEGLPPGAGFLSISREGYVSLARFAVDLKRPGAAALLLALEPEALLSGRVVDEKGKPVAAARVSVDESAPNLRGAFRRVLRMEGEAVPVRTDAAGKFRLFVPAGRRPAVSLIATAAKHAPAHAYGLKIAAGREHAGIELRLGKGLVARGLVVDADGAPVEGAGIEVERETEQGGRFGAVVRFVRSASVRAPDVVTGPRGEFELGGLEAGSYTLHVSHPEHPAKSVPNVVIKGEGENVISKIVLGPAAAIAGTVRDTAGQPIVDAQVLAFSFQGQQVNAQSDGQGRFRLGGLTPGSEVQLTANAPGYALLRKSVTPPQDALALVLRTDGVLSGRVEDAATREPVTDFSIAPSPSLGRRGFVMSIGSSARTFHTEDGTFTLPDVPPGKWTFTASSPGYQKADISGIEIGEGQTKEGVVFSLQKGAVLRGRVLDAGTGAPIAGATVSWSESGAAANPMAALGLAPANGTTTDGNGAFEIEGLPPEKITVTASAPDYLDASQPVDPTRQEEVDLSLGTGGSISGSVTTSDGAAVPGANVSLEELGGASPFGGGNSSVSDGSGGFEFDHLAAGAYRLTARSPSTSSAPQEIELTANERRSGVMLTLGAGTTVHGTVTGLAAGQLSGVRVIASGTGFSGSSAVDDSGSYVINGVPAGALRLTATVAALAGRSVAKSIEVSDGTPEMTVDIDFPPASTLSGHVTRSGRPLSGILVNVTPVTPGPNATSARGQTDDSGAYTVSGLSDGDYRVTLIGSLVGSGSSVAPSQRTVTLSGDTNLDIDLPALSVSGTVVEAGSSEPIAGVEVRAESGQETSVRMVRSAVTDSAGAFSIDDVDVGNYQLTAQKTGWQAASQTVAVNDSVSGVAFTLTRSDGVSIRAVDGLTGAPLRGVSVLAFGTGGLVGFSGPVTLDDSGEGAIPLAPGSYIVYVFSQGYAPRIVPGVVMPGPPVSAAMTQGGQLQIRIAPESAGVSARLVDSSGMPYLFNAFNLEGNIALAGPLTVRPNVAPGAYNLLVAFPDGTRSFPVTMTEGQMTAVQVQ
jgi:large repetitive protein